MTNQELISAIEKIENTMSDDPSQWTYYSQEVYFIQTIQFVRTYFGTETEFYGRLEVNRKDTQASNANDRWFVAKTVLEAIKNYLSNDLEVWETTSYKIKNDVVSDLLQQANTLLEKTDVHPAAGIILIGATLEEFLRILVDKHSLSLPPNKNSMSVYADALSKANIITKQDMKDITAWAGSRNEATHGHFEEVNDRKRAKNILEGVNLFMRKMSN